MKQTFIYRITHYKNLAFILKNGIHCPTSDIQDQNFVQIGFPSLIDKRNTREVPIEPFRTLADYVPFYFGVKSSMLYVTTMANDPEVIKTPPEEILYIVSTVERLEALNKDKIRLCKRYIGVYKDKKGKLGGFAVFDLIDDVWQGTTTVKPAKLDYLEDYRNGLLLYTKA